MDGLGWSHRNMEPFEAKRPTMVVKCEKHGLHYDSSKMDGCVICRREAGGAPAARPRPLGKALAIAALLLALTLAGFYFLETRKRPVEDRSFEEPTPQASFPAADTGGPVYA